MEPLIPFNKPYLSGKEVSFIEDAVKRGQLSGNGYYTKKCQEYFEEKYGFRKCLLTSSCTDALEMAALLINVEKGDEIIMPSYTFVSTANAFVLRGAKIVFADSSAVHPGIDEESLEGLITPKTKAIVVVHYAGISCDMDRISSIANRHNLYIIEDAAQAIDNYYINSTGEHTPLGGIGHLSTFSFHETKNIISGEGGMLVINDESLIERAEVIWEKGTNRAAFFRGEVDKYNWVDVGSSFLPSEITAAFLWGQLTEMDSIQKKRIELWKRYDERLSQMTLEIKMPIVPKHSMNNAHLFYVLCKDLGQRTALLKHLKKNNIHAVFHYLSLHKSTFFYSYHDGRELTNSDYYSDALVRLPLFYELTSIQQNHIINSLGSFKK